ncbi:hypothetical protein [Pseudomonas oryzihabitans]|uniref:hypothetical protein n=1 Tax=Pseudomonas oryzihabitans TaxID=47885 RepID=UPI0015E472E5|nr:hypothetical protein [Pseudomonas psychrotolerans]MBA1211550.1 hypothetical protein [Pseudomonas psychrotolerans]
MAEHLDIMQKPLRANDRVVFCRAGSSKRMTVGTVKRVLAKTVEIAFQLDPRVSTQYVFRSPEDVVRV